MNKRKIKIIATILLTGFAFFVYLILEINFLFSSAECSCALEFYPTLTSKIIGYALLIFSTALFIASIWQIKKLSRWWSILALFIFGIAFYGNGYALYTLSCTPSSITKITFYIHSTDIGDFVNKYELTDSGNLNVEENQGKLLGYSISGQTLTLYRIGEKPLKVKTSFLFWKIRPGIWVNGLSPVLHSYRNLEYEKNNKGYEFIGGQDMPLELFLKEIVQEKEFFIDKLKNKRIINETDGTTRFRFEIE